MVSTRALYTKQVFNAWWDIRSKGTLAELRSNNSDIDFDRDQRIGERTRKDLKRIQGRQLKERR